MRLRTPETDNLWSRLRARARSLSQCTFYGRSPSRERSLTSRSLSLSLFVFLFLSYCQFLSSSDAYPRSLCNSKDIRSLRECLQSAASSEPFPGWSMYRISRATYLDTNESILSLRSQKRFQPCLINHSHYMETYNFWDFGFDMNICI